MKIQDVIAALNAKATYGDTSAQIALLLAHRLADQAELMDGIEDVMKEIRNAIQEK